MKLLLKVVLALGVNMVASCPTECRCDSKGRVYCNGRALSFIPKGIPEDTKTLHLQDNQLESGYELNAALSELKQLERVMLYSNRLSEMPRFDSVRLRELRLNSNRITTIPAHVFDRTPNLGELILDENELDSDGITRVSFAGANQLRRLSMIDNRLQSVPLYLPVSLEELYLSSNFINTIPAGSLVPLVSLRELVLDHNRLNDSSFGADFGGRLAKIVLSHNELTTLPRLNSAIEELRLTSNSITAIHRDQLEAAPRLKVLDLAFNVIRHVENGAMERLFDLERVELDGRDYVCDCHLIGLKRFLESRVASQARSQLYVEQVLDKIICNGGEVSLGAMAEADMVCPVYEFEVINGQEQLIVAVSNDTLPPFPATNVLYFVDGALEGHIPVDTSNSRIKLPVSVDQPVDICVQAAADPVELVTSQQRGLCLSYEPLLITTTLPVDVVAKPVLGLGEVNMQIVVGVFIGAFVIALVVTVVIVLLVRRRRQFSEDDFESESKLSYCSKLTSLSSSERQPTNQGTAANQEFAFTLMLRDESAHLPRVLTSEPLINQLPTADRPIVRQNRTDDSLYI